MILNKEPFNPSNKQHKERVLHALMHLYSVNKRRLLRQDGIVITHKINRQIHKRAIAYAHNNFNRIKNNSFNDKLLK